jgi:hypothetical protein
VTSEDALTDYFRVGFAENPDFTGWHLMFHGGPANPAFTLPDEDYCLETQSAAFTFGGILSIELADSVLRLQLTHQATAELELPDPSIAITLNVSPDARRQAAHGLARVFAGTSSNNRPDHIHLPGTNLAAYGHRRRRTRKPQSTRLEFEVIGQTGQLVTVRSIDATKIRREPAERLGKSLGVDAELLVGTRFSCLLTPDNWGITYSDYRVVEPNHHR